MINHPTLTYVWRFLLCGLVGIGWWGESFAADKSNTFLGVRYRISHVHGVDLFGRTEARGLTIGERDYPLLKIFPRSYKRTVTIDSTGKYINFSQQILNLPLAVPARYELDEYLSFSRPHFRNLLWQEYKVKHLMDELPGSKRGRGGLDIDIPVKIKSKAFQTIFGGDRVGLTVNGSITINGGFRHENRSEVRTAITRGSNNNFRMEQTQQFKVTGNVGDKVKVSVDQDSERPFDFENTIKLNYTGYEDEIIQKIEAGNISLSLPSTRFVSFSGKNSGLFGLKAQAAMGNLKLTMIASQEKGENKKLTYTGGAREGVQTIKDYQYIKGVYFFLDHVYRDNYFPLKNGIHDYDPSLEIAEIELYRSTVETDPKAIFGYAAADPAHIYEDEFESTEEHREGYWARLEKTEYFVATDVGYIRLNSPVQDGIMLAVAYRDTSGNVYGDITYDAVADSGKPIHLKMLKPKNPRPNDLTWNLMFRHVYYLGARNISEDGFEVKIYYDPSSGDPEETIQVDGKPVSYLNLFGLDRVDKTGNPKPDNIIDKNENILRLGNGELEFPSLRPFADPLILPEEKFSDAMYDTTVQAEITRDSKFFIEVKSKSRSATMNLGWNVIEGSEEVRLNGRPLNKGTDYIIDYYS